MRIESTRERHEGRDLVFKSTRGEEVSVSRYNGEPIGGGGECEYLSIDAHMRHVRHLDPTSFKLGSGRVSLSVGSVTLYLEPDQYREVRDLMTKTLRKLR